MDRVKIGLRSIVMALAVLLVAPMVLAQESQLRPERPLSAQVEQITTELLGVIGQYSEQYPENEVEYFLALGGLLDVSVDFRFIAKQVMGPLLSKQPAQLSAIPLPRNFVKALLKPTVAVLLVTVNRKLFCFPIVPLKMASAELR